MEALSQTEWQQLSRMIVHMLDSWGLTASEQIALLALPEDTPKRSLRRYRDDTPLPDNEAVRERVEHLVGIAEALRTTYPTNKRMAVQWLRKPNRKFGERAPLALLKDGSLSGLISIRSQLDCVFMWKTMDNTQG